MLNNDTIVLSYCLDSIASLQEDSLRIQVYWLTAPSNLMRLYTTIQFVKQQTCIFDCLSNHYCTIRAYGPQQPVKFSEKEKIICWSREASFNS